MRFSTHAPKELGKKYVDEPELWAKTEEMVRQAMRNGGIEYTESPGEAAFYGPKIDVEVWSAIGREFSFSTNQVDFAVPARLGLVYTNSAGEEEHPICIHRALLGTHERTIGFLIEHFAGAFPVWLAPVQAVVLPIAERHGEYGDSVHRKLLDAGVRSELHGDSTLNYRIRQAQVHKVPYMLVLGDREAESGEVTIRQRTGEISIPCRLRMPLDWWRKRSPRRRCYSPVFTSFCMAFHRAVYVFRIFWKFRFYLGAAFIALVLWDSIFIKPFRLFVIVVHEVCHAGTALLTGGAVLEMRTNWDEGGHTLTQGGYFPLISAAGYVGSAAAGALLIYTSIAPSCSVSLCFSWVLRAWA